MLWGVGKTVFMALLGAVTAEVALCLSSWTVLLAVVVALSYLAAYLVLPVVRPGCRVWGVAACSCPPPHTHTRSSTARTHKSAPPRQAGGVSWADAQECSAGKAYLCTYAGRQVEQQPAPAARAPPVAY